MRPGHSSMLMITV